MAVHGALVVVPVEGRRPYPWYQGGLYNQGVILLLVLLSRDASPLGKRWDWALAVPGGTQVVLVE